MLISLQFCVKNFKMILNWLLNKYTSERSFSLKNILQCCLCMRDHANRVATSSSSCKNCPRLVYLKIFVGFFCSYACLMSSKSMCNSFSFFFLSS